MRWFISGMILALSGLLQAEELQYRLSGIIYQDFAKSIAIIEVIKGEEQLFRAGDVIGSGYVITITKRSVKLSLEGREELLYLEGIDSEEEESTELPAPLSETISSEIIKKLADLSKNQGKDTNKNRDFTLKTTLELPQNASITRINDVAVGSKQAKYTNKKLGFALKAVLRLPQDATITQVNDEAVGSNQAVIQKLVSILQTGDIAPISFSISGVDNMDRIYRFPIKGEEILE